MADSRLRSVDALKQLYTVIIGVALSAATFKVLDAQIQPLPLNVKLLPYFFVLVVLLIPFYHGAVRHLEATYVEERCTAKRGALLVDFIILFTEGCLFLLLALVLDVPQSFCAILVLLLLLDAIWGLLAHLAFTPTRPAEQTAETAWAKVNFATAAILVVLLLILVVVTEDQIWQKKMLLGWMLFTVVLVRTVIDYWYCWDFYYPDSDHAAE